MPRVRSQMGALTCTQGDPGSYDECKRRGYLGIKDSAGKGYCMQALLGTCKHTTTEGGQGCADEKGGPERTHACVRCGKFHTFAGAGVPGASPLRRPGPMSEYVVRCSGEHIT